MTHLKPSDLRNGDLIGWRKLRCNEKPSFYFNLVRIATLSEFGHVSVVWNNGDIISHVEATQPCITREALPCGEAYVIPMGLDLTDADMVAFFEPKLGLKYSMRDALMGYFGMIPSEENRYQCAELSNDFYREQGIIVTGAYTPSRLMRRMMRQQGLPQYYLNLD